MPYVVDTSALHEGGENILAILSEFAVPDCVMDEIAKVMPLSFVHGRNIRVVEPDEEYIDTVKERARETGDLAKLSPCDIMVVALALMLKATVVSGDYAILNLCSYLGLDFVDITGNFSEEIMWRFRCSGCGRYYTMEEAEKNRYICPVCGHDIRRKRR